MKKRLFALIVTALLAVSCLGLPVSAELPGSFWTINDNFIAAVDYKDADSAKSLCQQIIDILESDVAVGSRYDIPTMAATKLLQTAELLEQCGRFAESADMFKKYIPYAKQCDWADGVKIAENKILQYTTQLKMYQQTTTPQIYYGAKHEPKSGIYYGVTSDSDLADSINTTSSVLLYIEYGATDFTWPKIILDRARERGQMVTIALNCPRQGTDIANIVNDTSYVSQLLGILKDYQDLKIILRFGAEMNIWDNRAEPAQFVDAFRKITNLVRSSCSNIAMMWSPNSISSWDIEMNDYYPGDEYVDWVGCSLYSQKYFLGRNDWPVAEKFNEIVFQTGNSADPVLALTEVITKYGSKKPIALSESGVAHYTRSLDEDCTQWGLDQLEKMYRYIPMVYPQVKLIHYFDRSLDFEVVDVALYTNNTLKNRYLQLIKLPHFIQRGQNKAATYHELSSLMQAEDAPVYIYTHKFGEMHPNVAVLVDGKEASYTTSELGKYSLYLSPFAAGKHALQTVCGGEWAENQVEFQKPLKVYLNGELIGSDVPPTIINDSTMVPIRVISQALGANVVWNGTNRSIAIQLGNVSLTMVIDNPTMYIGAKEVQLPSAPVIRYDRTLVPLRAISEAFGIEPKWNGETRTVTLEK